MYGLIDQVINDACMYWLNVWSDRPGNHWCVHVLTECMVWLTKQSIMRACTDWIYGLIDQEINNAWMYWLNVWSDWPSNQWCVHVLTECMVWLTKQSMMRACTDWMYGLIDQVSIMRACTDWIYDLTDQVINGACMYWLNVWSDWPSNQWSVHVLTDRLTDALTYYVSQWRRIW